MLWDLIVGVVVVGLIVFSLLLVVSSPFRMAVIKRVRGEAAVAAEKLKAPMKNLALAISQYEQQANKLENLEISLESNRKGVNRKLKVLKDKRAEYEEAAKSWGAQGNRQKVEACVAKMDELDRQIQPLEARGMSLDAKIEQTKKLRVSINTAITTAKNKREDLGDRLVTAQAIIEVNQELQAVDLSGAAALIEEAEDVVAAEEDRAEAFSDMEFERNLAKTQEDDLLSVTRTNGPTFDSKVDSYLKKDVPLT